MTEKNAIARVMKALPAIAGLSELWAQQSDEPDDAYFAFLDWLDRGTARGSPPAQHARTASAHSWAERALAYERHYEMARAEDAGITPEVQVVSNLSRMVQIETAKLLRQSSSEPGAVVSLADLLKTVHLIKDLQIAGIAAESAKTDLSKLTTEEKKLILQAQLLLRKTQK